jgi:hypothetical protein
MGDHGEDWMDENWIVGQTVEEVNELWETRRCAGWWREVAGGTEVGGGGERTAAAAAAAVAATAAAAKRWRRDAE